MPSEPAAAHGGSFIVRIWCDQASAPQPHSQWRGWVQHVRTGKQIYFTSFDDLSSFIEHEVGIDSALDETLPGLV